MNRKHPWSYVTRNFVASFTGVLAIRWFARLDSLDSFSAAWWTLTIMASISLQIFIFALIGGRKENDV